MIFLLCEDSCHMLNLSNLQNRGYKGSWEPVGTLDSFAQIQYIAFPAPAATTSLTSHIPTAWITEVDINHWRSDYRHPPTPGMWSSQCRRWKKFSERECWHNHLKVEGQSLKSGRNLPPYTKHVRKWSRNLQV